MSYQALARKWRPRSFDAIVGQEHVVRALVNAFERDRLHRRVPKQNVPHRVQRPIVLDPANTDLPGSPPIPNAPDTVGPQGKPTVSALDSRLDAIGRNSFCLTSNAGLRACRLAKNATRRVDKSVRKLTSRGPCLRGLGLRAALFRVVGDQLRPVVRG